MNTGTLKASWTRSRGTLSFEEGEGVVRLIEIHFH